MFSKQLKIAASCIPKIFLKSVKDEFEAQKQINFLLLKIGLVLCF